MQATSRPHAKHAPASADHSQKPVEAASESPVTETDELKIIEFPKASWPAVALDLQPVTKGSFEQPLELTGKIALNEDHIAHLFPLVEGRVERVHVQFGQKVKQNDPIVVVQSQQVGQAKLQLFQDRLQRDFAVTKDEWTRTVSKNTLSLIHLIREGAQIAEIEKQLRDRPIGQYRDQLMTAYISHYKAGRHLERLEPLSEQGAITGKQLLEAQAEFNASRASLQSLIEQVQRDAEQAAIISAQTVQELQTRVAVDEANLRILGLDDDDLTDIDPVKHQKTLSHYTMKAPFDSTILTKDVVLMERVGPERQIASLADLSTVWVTTDLYEEHLSLLPKLAGKELQFRCQVWPERVFKATIFYTGDLVQETTRTLTLRALADNSEGLLKPGLFINVKFPSLKEDNVLQLPALAVQEHENQQFVFVYRGEDEFEKRPITVGARSGSTVEVLSGVREGEQVVVNGAFTLKSRLLADLLSE